MGISSIVLAADKTAIVSPDEIRARIGGDCAVAAWQLVNYAAQITSVIEGYLGRQLAAERVIETQWQSERIILMTERYPIVTLHGVTFRIDELLTGDRYAIEDARAGLIRLTPGSGYNPFYEAMGFGSGYSNYTPFGCERGPTKIAIEYTAGWYMPGTAQNGGIATVPADIRLAALEGIARLHASTTVAKAGTTASPALVAERLGDASWQYDRSKTEEVLGLGSLSLLERYRRAPI